MNTTTLSSRILRAGDAEFEARFTDLLSGRKRVNTSIETEVRAIISDVQRNGDQALLALCRKFDGADWELPDHLRVENSALQIALDTCPPSVRASLEFAASRISDYHREQFPGDGCVGAGTCVETGWKWTPVDAAGIYAPAGKAPYPSSVLMSVIPARVAGVKRVVLMCPTRQGKVDPIMLAAARLSQVDEVYGVGGAQAIAAMAFGTESISPVDIIAGPGNVYVAAAKHLVSAHVGIDLFAGPSEVLVFGDGSAPARWAAFDLLAQAEHDVLAQAILMTPHEDYAREVEEQIRLNLPALPRGDIARASWEKYGAIIVVPDWNRAIDLSGRISPEHFHIATRNPKDLASRIPHAGAFFLGVHAPEAIGDYVAGPSHVLPTHGTARFASGLSTLTFLKRSSYISVDQSGLQDLGPHALVLAQTESLDAHAQSIACRLDMLP